MSGQVGPSVWALDRGRVGLTGFFFFFFCFVLLGFNGLRRTGMEEETENERPSRVPLHSFGPDSERKTHKKKDPKKEGDEKKTWQSKEKKCNNNKRNESNWENVFFKKGCRRPTRGKTPRRTYHFIVFHSNVSNYIVPIVLVGSFNGGSVKKRLPMNVRSFLFPFVQRRWAGRFLLRYFQKKKTLGLSSLLLTDCLLQR